MHYKCPNLYVQQQKYFEIQRDYVCVQYALYILNKTNRRHLCDISNNGAHLVRILQERLSRLPFIRSANYVTIELQLYSFKWYDVWMNYIDASHIAGLRIVDDFTEFQPDLNTSSKKP